MGACKPGIPELRGESKSDTILDNKTQWGGENVKRPRRTRTTFFEDELVETLGVSNDRYHS